MGGISEVARNHSEGAIVPHHNRTRMGGCPQSAVAGRPPCRSRGTRDPTRWVFSLHGDSVLPTRRIASPYTESLSSLHGETAFFARYVTYSNN